MRTLDLLSGLIPAALQAALVAIFIRRKLYRQFPFFFSYNICSVLVAAVRLSVMGSPVTFFVLYWTTEIVYGGLALLAIWEVFKPRTRWLMMLPLLMVTTYSLWQAAYHPVGHGPLVRLAAGAYGFVRGALWIEILALAIGLGMSRRKSYPVEWGRYRFGILAGFGLAAGATLAADFARTHFGPGLDAFFRYVPAGAYVGAAAMWLLAFCREETIAPRKTADLEAIERELDYVTEQSEKARRILIILAANLNK